MVAVCSSHPFVLRTAMRMALDSGAPLLIEATANQVNPFGGYTGMRPDEFSRSIHAMAGQIGLADRQVLIGADHLGPHVWKQEPAAAAMQKAEVLVRQCIQAGFQKIHLDTAARCADEPGTDDLPLTVIVQRAAQLCRVAEAAQAQTGNRPEPLYVIGNEVPAPGGALAQGSALQVTDPEDLMAALHMYEKAFAHAGVTAAWQRVVAVVVQPGVDFGDRHVAAYRHAPAGPLSAAHARLPGIMTCEVHATDYQRPDALRQMVQDHFILLKVGPCLTYALREALWALSDIEAALPGIERPANLRQVMMQLMTAHPEHWRSHYTGSPEEQAYLRQYSLRDRIRYYWAMPEARQAVRQLLGNLGRPIPAELLQRCLPDLYPEIGAADLPIDPTAIIQAHIRRALDPYWAAAAGE
jgi:D-tagatose-1,6-bisphosphate aldolase subunit GatZ/KbaZ